MLHVEIRAHVYFFMEKSLSRTWKLDQEVHEPDAEIVQLNADLVRFDEELAAHLYSQQQKYVTTGLALLLEQIIVTSASQLTVMNAAGCSKMRLNILVLQQNLKNIEADASLLRSELYFDMFAAGPGAVITQAKNEGKDSKFSYSEMKTLLQLCYSEALKSDRREVVVAAERGLEAHNLELSEFLW
jgi:exocyst complex component 4